MELGLVVDGGGRRARHLPVCVCGVGLDANGGVESRSVVWRAPPLPSRKLAFASFSPLFPFLNSALVVCWGELIPRSPTEASRDSPRVYIPLSSPLLSCPALLPSLHEAGCFLLPFPSVCTCCFSSIPCHAFHPNVIPPSTLSLAWRMKLACITNLSHQPQ